jgi:hypothetical protein
MMAWETSMRQKGNPLMGKFFTVCAVSHQVSFKVLSSRFAVSLHLV